MTKYRKIIYVAISLLLSSCEGVFVPDPYDPRLPRYTEEGNNFGGAIMNDKIWQSENRILCDKCNAEIRCIPTKNKMEIYLAGILEGGGVGRIQFHLTDLEIKNLSDFKLLHNKKISLNGIHNYMNFNEYQGTAVSLQCKNLGGQLYFKNVRVDTLNRAIILSGTFGSICEQADCVHCDLSFGRFDYRFNHDENLFFD